MDKKNHMSSELLASIKDRRSVRTTFKLDKKTNENIARLAKQQGVRQKDVIDLCMSVLYEDYKQGENKENPVLKQISSSLSNQNSENADLAIRKTLVISRRSLSILTEMSEACHISRNKLLEFAIRKLQELKEIELEELKKAHEEIKSFISDLEERMASLEKSLAPENPALLMLYWIHSMANDTEANLDCHINMGTPLEWYDWMSIDDDTPLKKVRTFGRAL